MIRSIRHLLVLGAAELSQHGFDEFHPNAPGFSALRTAIATR
jgi:hypothetical protein